MSTAIHFENVNFSYADALILTNTSVSINEGEFISIIGPNGGGKTTFLKLIMGFLRPHSGLVAIYNTTAGQARQLIGYVPQVLHLDRYFPISLFEVVLSGRLSKTAWYRSYTKEDKQAAMHWIEFAGLIPFINQSFGSLSGGQAQRALIARALVSDPKLLLLDEPTACVDTQAEDDIQRMLRNLKDKMTILMVTHDLEEIIDHVHKVLCIHGNIISLEPSEVCKHVTMGLYHHNPLINEKERK